MSGKEQWSKRTVAKYVNTFLVQGNTTCDCTVFRSVRSQCTLHRLLHYDRRLKGSRTKGVHTKHFPIYYIQYVYCMWVRTRVNVGVFRVGKPSPTWKQLNTQKDLHLCVWLREIQRYHCKKIFPPKFQTIYLNGNIQSSFSRLHTFCYDVIDPSIQRF